MPFAPDVLRRPGAALPHQRRRGCCAHRPGRPIRRRLLSRRNCPGRSECEFASGKLPLHGLTVRRNEPVPSGFMLGLSDHLAIHRRRPRLGFPLRLGYRHLHGLTGWDSPTYRQANRSRLRPDDQMAEAPLRRHDSPNEGCQPRRGSLSDRGDGPHWRERPGPRHHGSDPAAAINDRPGKLR